MLYAECEQKNPIEKPFKLERHVVRGVWTKKSDKKAIQVLYTSERHIVCRA